MGAVEIRETASEESSGYDKLSLWSHLRGHREPIEMFRRSIRRNRLCHGYLFVGPSGIGKRKFAELLAQCLFCQRHADAELEACGACSGCKPFLAGAHPDFLAVGCPAGKRELPIELFVGTRERRGKEGLCYELSLRPMAGHRRIALIDDADLMNEASANALLKTLEEPPENSLLILIASNLDSLLPTIRSRCQLVRFAPLSPVDVAELLLEQNFVENRQDAETVAALSEGGLTAAQQILDPQLQTLRRKLYAHLGQRDFSGLGAATAMIEGVEALGGETAAQRQNAAWIIRFCVEFYRSALLALSGQTDSGVTAPIPEAVRWSQQFSADDPDAVELVGSLLDHGLRGTAPLEQNVSVSLCLEAFFDELARWQRGVRV